MEIDAGFNDFFEEVKDAFEAVGNVDVKDHIAIHVNVTDMGNRPFYIEIYNGLIDLKPFGYYDNDAVINADSKSILDMVHRETDLKDAYTYGRVGAYGNLYKLSVLRDILKYAVESVI